MSSGQAVAHVNSTPLKFRDWRCWEVVFSQAYNVIIMDLHLLRRPGLLPQPLATFCAPPCPGRATRSRGGPAGVKGSRDGQRAECRIVRSAKTKVGPRASSLSFSRFPSRPAHGACANVSVKPRAWRMRNESGSRSIGRAEAEEKGHGEG